MQRSTLCVYNKAEIQNNMKKKESQMIGTILRTDITMVFITHRNTQFNKKKYLEIIFRTRVFLHLSVLHDRNDYVLVLIWFW